MEKKKFGYTSKRYDFPTKRYYQTLDLKNDANLIEMYRQRHQKGFYWDEVGAGIREIGVLEMEIFIYNQHLVMVVETALDFDWEKSFEKLSEMPIQIKWEEYMAMFQDADSKASSSEKWQRMERIFQLP